jgi:hypothetical protein
MSKNTIACFCKINSGKSYTTLFVTKKLNKIMEQKADLNKYHNSCSLATGPEKPYILFEQTTDKELL